jgi:hypothetical protein
MATAARSAASDAGKGARAKAAPDPEPPHVCTVGFCPICMAVAALQPLKPEVVEHLLNAGREFLLAVKAAVDARANDVTDEADRKGRLEHIDIG